MISNIQPQWENPIFREITLETFAALILIAALLFPFRKRNVETVSTWASLQSWLFSAPFAFAMIAAGNIWPILGFILLGILGVKEFFQITGMYHRSSFVWLTYGGIILLGYEAHMDHKTTYDLLPMMFLGCLSLVPILLNDAKNMIQYLALSLMGYIFLGWGLLYALWIAQIPTDGPLILLYISLLTEFSDQVNLGLSRVFSKNKLVANITPLRTREGFAAGVVVSLILAYGIRHLLPHTEPTYWITLGLISSIVGTLGDLILSVIRRDIGVRDTGFFIIGRGGFLDRLDRLIFVFPCTYYALQILNDYFQA